MLMPSQDLNEYLFPLGEEAETTPFDEGFPKFITTYKRQNPATQEEANKAYYLELNGGAQSVAVDQKYVNQN